MNTPNTTTNSVELRSQMSKFQTVEAAKLWWSSLSPSQKGAVLGTVTAVAMGGYAFFATYKVTGISVALWNSIIYGSIAGASVAVLASQAYTPLHTAQVKRALNDL